MYWDDITFGLTNIPTSIPSRTPNSRLQAMKNTPMARGIPTPDQNTPVEAISPSYDGNTAYSDLIGEASQAYGLDPRLLSKVIQTESAFNPNAKSSAGAMGLMQLMPATAQGLGVTNPYDPRQNIMGGAKFLRQMIDMSGGDVNIGLARYNWGPGNVNKWQSRGGGFTNMPKETQNYIRRITG